VHGWAIQRSARSAKAPRLRGAIAEIPCRD
jgi:hypothetical protein